MKQIEQMKQESSTNSAYKLIVKSTLEDKIRFMCASLPHEEWSGILFYKVEGSLKTNDLKLTCEDMLILDIGNKTYTEFAMDPEVAGYMVENSLIDCYQGLIHSHNSMPTFFSGTDTQTLLTEGAERNHFVSLIVNNEGVYSAKITKNIITDGIFKGDVYYNTFENVAIDKKQIEREIKTNKVEFIDLNIEIESNSTNKGLQSIINKIRQKKSHINIERQFYAPLKDMEPTIPFPEMNIPKINFPEMNISKLPEEEDTIMDIQLSDKDLQFITRVANSLVSLSMSPLDKFSKFNDDGNVTKWIKNIDRVIYRVFDNEGSITEFVFHFTEALFQSVIRPYFDPEYCTKEYGISEQNYEEFISTITINIESIIEEYNTNDSKYLNILIDELTERF